MTELSSDRIQELTIDELEAFTFLVSETLETLKGRQSELDIVEDLNNLIYILITDISDTIAKIASGKKGHQ